MSDLKADEFDKDYWFEMYQGQCATTDEWVKKYRDEVERKADATLLARCAELQRIAEVANAMVGKSRDQVESQAARIKELEAMVQHEWASVGLCIISIGRLQELESSLAAAVAGKEAAERDAGRWQAFVKQPELTNDELATIERIEKETKT